MPIQNTYALSTPMPCDDCENYTYCKPNGKSCKVSRHWETYGTVMWKKGTKTPHKRVPDGDIKIVI